MDALGAGSLVLLISQHNDYLEDLVEEFLEICGGLPLFLEVFGGLLAGNLDKTYWMPQLKKFSKRLPVRYSTH